MADALPITLAYGDGIGPEIVDAILVLLRETKAEITLEVTDIGGKLYKHDYKFGVAPYAWESIKRTRVLLKGPVNPPPAGFIPVNTTLAERLSLHTSSYHLRSFPPLCKTQSIDTVIMHTNECMLGGLEEAHDETGIQHTTHYSAALAEQSVSAAYSMAVRMGRKKVTCVTRKNLFPESDGWFHEIFERISEQYPKLISDHFLLEDVITRLRQTPETLDVIITPHAHGQLLATLAARQVNLPYFTTCSLIGEETAVFGADHTADGEHHGEQQANPSAMIIGLCQMLAHLGLVKTANIIENAWLCTLEEECRTKDFDFSGASALSTLDFVQAVTERLGRTPARLAPARWTLG